ncbi:MAG: hypothetical protein AAGG01_09080, partial [Planctomycetota bacterium]
MKNCQDRQSSRLGLPAGVLLLALGSFACSSAEKGPVDGAGESTLEADDPTQKESDQLREASIADIAVLRAEGSLRRLAPGTYLRPAASVGEPAMLLEGLDGLTLDLTGVELRGQVVDADLDEATGVGIRLVGCRDVTIKGAVIGGYKVCLDLRDCEDVIVEGIRCDRW